MWRVGISTKTCIPDTWRVAPFDENWCLGETIVFSRVVISGAQAIHGIHAWCGAKYYALHKSSTAIYSIPTLPCFQYFKREISKRKKENPGSGFIW